MRGSADQSVDCQGVWFAKGAWGESFGAMDLMKNMLQVLVIFKMLEHVFLCGKHNYTDCLCLENFLGC